MDICRPKSDIISWLGIHWFMANIWLLGDTRLLQPSRGGYKCFRPTPSNVVSSQQHAAKKINSAFVHCKKLTRFLYSAKNDSGFCTLQKSTRFLCAAKIDVVSVHCI